MKNAPLWILTALMARLAWVSPAMAAVKGYEKKTHPKQEAKLQEYTHPEKLYQLKYPSSWEVKRKDKGLIIKSKGPTEKSSIFGIVCRDKRPSNEKIVKKEFKARNKPADLTQEPTRVAGCAATKVEGSDKYDPRMHMVEYYLKNPSGQQYYILMRAPQRQWPQNSRVFYKMLQSLSFN